MEDEKLEKAKREYTSNVFLKESVAMLIDNLKSRAKIDLDATDKSEALKNYVLLDDTIEQLILLRDGYCDKEIAKSEQKLNSLKNQSEQLR